MVPISGEYLQTLRKALKKSRSEVVKNLSKGRTTLLRYELNQVGVYKAFLKGLVDLYGKYSFDGGLDLDKLRKLASSDLSWVKVKQITVQKPKSKWVYDFTVEGVHNFVANGVIVHNTTQAAKLANYLTKKGFKPGLICADKFRPGAFDQLKQLGAEVKVPVYGNPDEKKPWNIAKEGLDKFKDKNVVIIDSEGRHSLDADLMDEIEHLHKDVKPDYTILVLDSTIGQQAETQALAFKERAGVNGIILTKLDGSAKGGGGISACAAAEAPVLFIGVGERISDLERFDPKAFVGRLMGFGDVKGLLEKFQEHVDKEDAEDAAKRMMAGKFTLVDVYEQLEQVKKMGPLSKVAEMLPGMGGAMKKMPKDMINVQEEKMKKFKPILQSMTQYELENPKLSRARVERIAEGSGTRPEDVRALIQQYNQMRSGFKKLRKNRQFAKMFKGMDAEMPA
jgi:signal recognition particle subunit SRP54